MAAAAVAGAAVSANEIDEFINGALVSWVRCFWEFYVMLEMYKYCFS